MIDLFKKLEMYVDYNNSYSVRKAMTTLNREFNLAINSLSRTHAMEVVETAKKLYEKFRSIHSRSNQYGETLDYHRESFAKQMNNFIAHLTRQMHSKFGGSKKYEQEIEQAIQ